MPGCMSAPTTESAGTLEAPNRIAGATRGVAYAVIAAFGFALMGFCVHDAKGAMTGTSLALWRGVVSCIFLLPVVWRDLPRLFQPGGGWLWMRSAAGAGSVLSFFWTLQHTALSAARALADMAPAFVCVLAWLRGVERPSLTQSFVIALMTTAAVSLDLGAVKNLSTTTAIIGFCGAFSASLAYVALRRAAQRFTNSLVVFTLGVGLILGAPLVPGESITLPSYATLLPIVGVGVLGLAAQLVFTRAFVHLSAPVASALSVTALIFSVLLDALVVHNVPSPYAIFCYAAIMTGAVTLHILELRLRKKAALELTPDSETPID